MSDDDSTAQQTVAPHSQRFLLYRKSDGAIVGDVHAQSIEQCSHIPQDGQALIACGEIDAQSHTHRIVDRVPVAYTPEQTHALLSFTREGFEWNATVGEWIDKRTLHQAQQSAARRIADAHASSALSVHEQLRVIHAHVIALSKGHSAPDESLVMHEHNETRIARLAAALAEVAAATTNEQADSINL